MTIDLDRLDRARVAAFVIDMNAPVDLNEGMTNERRSSESLDDDSSLVMSPELPLEVISLPLSLVTSLISSGGEKNEDDDGVICS